MFDIQRSVWNYNDHQTSGWHLRLKNANKCDKKSEFQVSVVEPSDVLQSNLRERLHWTCLLPYLKFRAQIENKAQDLDMGSWIHNN